MQALRRPGKLWDQAAEYRKQAESASDPQRASELWELARRSDAEAEDLWRALQRVIDAEGLNALLRGPERFLPAKLH